MRKLIILLMLLSFNVFAEPVNINKANAKEIAASLDGVGEKKAQEIVKYRKDKGSFKSINDLENVKGIGEKTIAKNKKNIKL
ncbi:ComEA family DNA-binding protein [Methyloprofundus sp.]|uniref:ComEA family DNA-binding protein n=1 Tax=Methyloprofundus sp. TaxID=2020875 RepID=UPI003D0F55CD